MQKITSVDGLKHAIQLLEIEQEKKGRLLKDQLIITYNSLRPVNIIRKTLKDIFTPSGMVENMSGSAIGATSGYLLKRYLIGSSESKLRRLIASIIQFGITVPQHDSLISLLFMARLYFTLYSGKKK
jgi:hypothetical protein